MNLARRKDKQGKRDGWRKGKRKAEASGWKVQGAGCRVHAGQSRV